MNQESRISSLLSPQAMGGDIAEGGFQYQANLIVARVPDWLAQDGFSEMIRESLGDVEAKFFVPGIGLSREFIEYKNHRMKPSGFWREVEHFQRMDTGSPNAYHRFVLACTGVSTELSAMINALRRIRDAYSFYEGAHQIQETSYGDFLEIVVRQGKSKSLADFLFSKVWFEIDLTNAEDRPRELFREALLNHFPAFDDFPMKVSTEAYLRLVELVRSRKNQPIYRQELEDTFWRDAQNRDRPEPTLRIHTRHDETCDGGPHGCLQFDWRQTFGGSDREYPPPDYWNQQIVGHLRSTKAWMVSTQRHRRISLSGHRRLSASIALGTVFSAVSGFVIGIQTKEGIWYTNSYPKTDTPDYPWTREVYGYRTAHDLVVAISIMRHISKEVERYLEGIALRVPQLHLLGQFPLLSAEHANRAVEGAKQAIQEMVAEISAEKIHLFVAAPAAFALFLGHRLNAMGEVQCYEYQRTNEYCATCLIHT